MKSKLSNFLILLIGGLIFYLLIEITSFYNQSVDEKIKKGKHEFTIGRFNRIGNIGSSGSRFIELKYYVKGQEYLISKNSNHYFWLCKKEDCSDKKFWILYLVDDPSFALVDITNEIKDSLKAKPPKNLDNFK